MPPALQNPFVLWLVLSGRPGRRSRYFGDAPGAARARDPLRLVPDRLPGGALAALRPRRPAGQDPPGPRPARAASTWCSRSITDDALIATVDDAVQHRARAGERARASSTRRRPARRRPPPSGRGRRAGACQGRARPAARTSSGRLGRPRAVGEARFVVQDDRALRAPGCGPQTVKEAITHAGAARQPAGRRRAGHRRSTATKGDQILVQLPGVQDVEQAKRVIQTTAQLTLKLVEDQAGTREILLQTTGGKVPDNMEVVRGPGRDAGPARLLPGAPRGGHHRPRPQERARQRRREQPARRQLHAEPDGRRQVQARPPAATSAAGWRSSSTVA